MSQREAIAKGDPAWRNAPVDDELVRKMRDTWKKVQFDVPKLLTDEQRKAFEDNLDRSLTPDGDYNAGREWARKKYPKEWRTAADTAFKSTLWRQGVEDFYNQGDRVKTRQPKDSITGWKQDCIERAIARDKAEGIENIRDTGGYCHADYERGKKFSEIAYTDNPTIEAIRCTRTWEDCSESWRMGVRDYYSSRAKDSITIEEMMRVEFKNRRRQGCIIHKIPDDIDPEVLANAQDGEIIKGHKSNYVYGVDWGNVFKPVITDVGLELNIPEPAKLHAKGTGKVAAERIASDVSRKIAWVAISGGADADPDRGTPLGAIVLGAVHPRKYDKPSERFEDAAWGISPLTSQIVQDAHQAAVANKSRYIQLLEKRRKQAKDNLV